MSRVKYYGKSLEVKNCKVFGRCFIILTFIFSVSGCRTYSGAEKKSDAFSYGFIKALDISYLPELEERGAEFFSNGVKMDFFDIIKDAGINTVRIRLWNDNPLGESSIDNLIKLGKRAVERDLKVLADFHYSDTWGDPGSQSKPEAWKYLSFDELNVKIRKYTADVITECINNGVYPDFVQTGNEISAGFLWDSGRVGGSFNDNWNGFTELLISAINGVRDADSDNRIKTIVHHHSGSDYNGMKWFFDNIEKYNVPYDIIGVSYYPFYSKDTVTRLKNVITRVKELYGKPVFVVETAYPWTAEWGDDTHNVFGDGSYLLPEFPAGKEGQEGYIKYFLREMYDAEAVGVAYWGAEWIPVEGFGSSWENLALFDFEGNALPALLNAWRDSSNK